MKDAKQRLDEWAKHSPPLAYITECLKKVMTPEIAGWVMQEGKTAKGLWDFIEKQAKNLHKKGTSGVLFSPTQMQECIYAYLRDGEPTHVNEPATNEPETNEPDTSDDADEGQLSLIEDFDPADGDDQLTLI